MTPRSPEGVRRARGWLTTPLQNLQKIERRKEMWREARVLVREARVLVKEECN